MTWRNWLVPAVLLAIWGCDRRPAGNTGPGGGQTMSIRITSTAFESGQPIPRKYTGEGQDVSPALSWQGVPAGTKELALIVDDPDAPTPQPFVHWVIYKIPPTMSGLPEGVATDVSPSEPAGAMQGRNDFKKTGYGGPMPPKGHGTHHYHFKLYALDKPLNVQPGLDKAALLAAMKGSVIAEGELIGTYERS
jgi:Raf kinase inhibitor-like YbhB/YbcL family protein